MYRKNCYKCLRPSFSSTLKGTWICPICRADLTKIKATEATVWDKAYSFQYNEHVKGRFFSDK